MTAVREYAEHMFARKAMDVARMAVDAIIAECGGDA